METTIDHAGDSRLVMSQREGRICAEGLTALATGQILVLHVRGFVLPPTCALLTAALHMRGFVTSSHYVSDFRRACTPFSSPIDALRCTLEEVWPKGARLQSLRGRKMSIGYPRLVEPGTVLLAQRKTFPEMLIDGPGFHARLCVDICIQMPSSGGELLVWKAEIPQPMFNRLRGGDYGISIDRIGLPDVTVQSAPGDLLIFNSAKMHATSQGTGCNRLSVCCFIGYRGESAPLSFWG